MPTEDRGHGDYVLLTSGAPRRRPRLLRTADLDVVGRAALVGTCAASAGLGALAGPALGLPRMLTGGAAAVVPVAVTVALDRVRWRRMSAGYDWGAAPADVEAVAADLSARGVAAGVRVADDGETASLVYRNADADAVSRALQAHGRPGLGSI